MPDIFAAIRPDDQSFALLLHIVGATVTFGALLASATALALARGETQLLRLGYFALLLVGLPGLILMRVAGEWIYRKQGWEDISSQIGEPQWLGIGFIVADWGGLLFLVALALGGIGLYRLRSGNGAVLLKATMVISMVLVVAYVVAVWAMTGKPS